jgi:hypothetical protein
MTKKNSPTVQSAEQFSRFVETARALECDEDKERFEAALGKIATHKPRDPDKGTVKAKALKVRHR